MAYVKSYNHEKNRNLVFDLTKNENLKQKFVKKKMLLIPHMLAMCPKHIIFFLK